MPGSRSELPESREIPFGPESLAALGRKYRVPGAQLAVHRRGRTETVEWGELRDGSHDHPVDREAAFPVGSITKSFTATLAMILVADGEIDLDTPVRSFSPPLRLGADLTVRQLLSHTSGLVSGPELLGVRTESPRRYLIDHCDETSLLLSPGTRFSYSNLGYVMVAWLVETVTGMTWADAVDSILLRPLGIGAGLVGVGNLRAPSRPVAVGHSVDLVTGRIRPVTQSMAPAEAATAALAVSAADLVRLAMTHVDPGLVGSAALLPETHAMEMRRAVACSDPYGLADGWALGFSIYREGGTEWLGHDGNANGTACFLRFQPATGTVVAFTSNANTGFGMWLDILDELRDAEPSMAVPHGHVVPTTRSPGPPPDDAAGVYDNGGIDYTITVDDGDRIRLSVAGGADTVLTCHGDLTLSRLDPHCGRQLTVGRFLHDTVTNRIEAVQLAGRVAIRRSGDTRGNRPDGT